MNHPIIVDPISRVFAVNVKGIEMAAFSSILDTIGNTPVVDVSELSTNQTTKIYAKLENLNPAGSVKDRVAAAMIQKAEQDGLLEPGVTIIEPSSGNTGIALALIAQLKGYKINIVLPENVSFERRQMLEIFGANIILSPGQQGSNGAIALAQQLAAQNPEWVFLYQYANEANPKAHYDTTGPEILKDVPGITHFVAGLGTSGTLMGVGTYLKEHKPDVKIMAVEPPIGETVEGLRSLTDGYIPPIYENWKGPQLLDGKRVVRLNESIQYTRLLASKCGIFSGISAGAAAAGAVRIAEKTDNAVIVFIVCDGGWKYLSTGAWTDNVEDIVERTQNIIYF